MLVTITGHSKIFVADGVECRNILCAINGREISVTVQTPVTPAKIKQALIRYCTIHKERLGIGDSVAIEPQSFDIPELDAL